MNQPSSLEPACKCRRAAVSAEDAASRGDALPRSVVHPCCDDESETMSLTEHPTASPGAVGLTLPVALRWILLGIALWALAAVSWLVVP